jgi:hypothetical protein
VRVGAVPSDERERVFEREHRESQRVLDFEVFLRREAAEPCR